MEFDPEKMATIDAKKCKIVTASMVKKWKLPCFQRASKWNEKKRQLVETIKKGEAIPGVITLGILSRSVYIVDGQQRLDCFMASGLQEVLCEMRVKHFASVAEMAKEFDLLNGNLIPMRPDDILKALEEMNPNLAKLRKECPFVGYDMIRRGDSSPILSMSTTIRGWVRSAPDCPTGQSPSVRDIAATFSIEDTEQLIVFLKTAFAAWGKDREYGNLWSSLNLVLTMWLYRRVVLRVGAVAGSKVTRLTREQFQSAIMALSAADAYVEWLRGRRLDDTDRAPCYRRMTKDILGPRITELVGKKAMFPSPPWSHGASGR